MTSIPPSAVAVSSVMTNGMAGDKCHDQRNGCKVMACDKRLVLGMA